MPREQLQTTDEQWLKNNKPWLMQFLIATNVSDEHWQEFGTWVLNEKEPGDDHISYLMASDWVKEFVQTTSFSLWVENEDPEYWTVRNSQ